MGQVSLDDILVTPMNRIPTPGGDVLHAMKRGERGYIRFGEAYFSIIQPGAIKAWKRHMRLTMNLVVPVGSVRFVFHVSGNDGAFRVEEIGENRYVRLTVPNEIWHGFQGIAEVDSLIMNLADITHDPTEVERCDKSAISFSW